MKLYKFRPLGTCQDLERAQEILKTGKFWCSRFWELNDPMEGVYSFDPNSLRKETIRSLYGEKSKHAICSFSGQHAFESPMMWGYYANGFKGIAIEIEVDDDENKIHQVNYASSQPKITSGKKVDETVKQILTTKLCCWNHEQEYRYICSIRSNGSSLRKIGRISTVYFGTPFKTTVNAKNAQERPRVREYLCRVEAMKQTVKSKRIPCRRVDVVDGKVTITKQDEGACQQP